MWKQDRYNQLIKESSLIKITNPYDDNVHYIHEEILRSISERYTKKDRIESIVIDYPSDVISIFLNEINKYIFEDKANNSFETFMIMSYLVVYSSVISDYFCKGEELSNSSDIYIKLMENGMLDLLDAIPYRKKKIMPLLTEDIIKTSIENGSIIYIFDDFEERYRKNKEYMAYRDKMNYILDLLTPKLFEAAKQKMGYHFNSQLFDKDCLYLSYCGKDLILFIRKRDNNIDIVFPTGSRSEEITFKSPKYFIFEWGEPERMKEICLRNSIEIQTINYNGKSLYKYGQEDFIKIFEHPIRLTKNILFYNVEKIIKND